MSTELQQYSMENQGQAIREYAGRHGFEIVRTYTDAGKSGVVLGQRAGLRELLQDVVSGNARYRAILVYDISRWGRFQDTDEAAHYEFLCKSSGVHGALFADQHPVYLPDAFHFGVWAWDQNDTVGCDALSLSRR